MGMAVYATQATRVTDETFIVAARAVAEQVTNGELASGLIYPPQFPGSIALFSPDLWAVGLLGAALRIDRSAYRYAGVTLAIVMIVPRSASPWLRAIHRFCEVSIGIAVSLTVSALWPERPEWTQRLVDFLESETSWTVADRKESVSVPSYLA